MVIMYQSSRLLWHLVGRWLVRTQFLSLVNILAGRESCRVHAVFQLRKPIQKTCNSLLSSRLRLTKISSELVDVVKPLVRAMPLKSRRTGDGHA